MALTSKYVLNQAPAKAKNHPEYPDPSRPDSTRKGELFSTLAETQR